MCQNDEDQNRKDFCSQLALHFMECALRRVKYDLCQFLSI